MAILANSTLKIEATGASMRTDLTIQVVETGGDTAAPVITVPVVPSTVGNSAYTFTGTVADASDVASLKLDGADVTYAANGAFSAPVALAPGSAAKVCPEGAYTAPPKPPS